MTLAETVMASHHCPEYLARQSSTGMCIYRPHRSRGSSNRWSECGPWTSCRSRACWWDGTSQRRCIWEGSKRELTIDDCTFDDWLLEVFQIVILYQGASQQSPHLILMNIINQYQPINHHWIKLAAFVWPSHTSPLFFEMLMKFCTLIRFETIGQCIIQSQQCSRKSTS